MDNIIEIDLSTTKRSLNLSAQYQYDYGLILRLRNAPECPPGCQLLVEMCNIGDKQIQNDFTYSGDDIAVPDDLLNDGRDLQLYICADGTDFFKTLLVINVKILRRPSR